MSIDKKEFSDFKIKVGKRLRKFRKTLNKTQDEFSRGLEVSKPAYVRYEAGDRFPTITMLHLLYIIYRMDLNWLIIGEGDMFVTTETPEQSRIRYLRETDPEKCKEYLDMIRLMEYIPGIERAILSKTAELKRIFKDDIKKELPD